MSQGYRTGAASHSHSHLLSDIAADPIEAGLAAIIREVRPGDRLPSERELASRLKVSRTALRDRLRSLESAGILRRRSGSGTYVEPVNPEGLTRTLAAAVAFCGLPKDSLLTALESLDRQAVRDAAVRADPAALDRLSVALDTMRHAAEPADALAAHRTFHEVLVEAAGSPAVRFLRTGVLGALRDAGMLWPDYTTGETPLAVPTGLYERHERIYQAIARHDPLAAMLAFD